MKIACLQFNPIQENTYVVWDNTKACIVIDAGNSNPREDAALDNFIAEHGLKPVMAVNTTAISTTRWASSTSNSATASPSPSRRRTGSCWTTQRRAVRSSA